MRTKSWNIVIASGILLLLLGTSILVAAKMPTPPLSVHPVDITITNTDDVVAITYQITDYSMEHVTIQGNDYVQIHLGNEPQLLEKGKPDLPSICRSVIIPDTKKMDVRVVQASYEDIHGIRVAPSKGNLPRTVNPDDIPYIFDETYTENAWFPAHLVTLPEPYILRDYRGQVAVVNPFQYNPVEETLRVYKTITIEIYSVGVDTVNCLLRTGPPSVVDTDFKQIYENHFLNFPSDRYNPVGEQGNMLIIVYNNFWDNMLSFYHWKLAKGVPTEMVKVSEIGANANAIKSYIAGYYQTKGLTFVLLVGDSAQVPPYMLSGDASDPSYSYIVGNDHYPDLFVGRFSAETTGQVDTQVERSIEYEKTPQVNGEWYHKGTGIGSQYGPGDDGEYDWQHINNIRAKLLAFTYTEVDQIYNGTATAAMVTAALNNGRSILNYCGHGSQTSWGTTGFSNSDVNALANDNMLPFIDSVACLNGDFDGQTCFAEAWLRATHNGEPTGALATFMSSISQSWNPPMAAEDETIDLLVGTYQDNTKTTIGGLYYNGDMKMNDDYGSDGYAETDYWTIFGDPSLQVRTKTPEPMNVVHNPVIPLGAPSFEVNVPGVKGALCALSREGELLAYGYTDATGYVLLEFNGPLTGVENITLVVTAFNKVTYLTQLLVYAGYPPVTPAIPTGPSFGNVGLEYTFSSVTTDPDGDNISYLFDWGDGNFSAWVGPFASGTPGSASHAWMQGGDYEVRCKAKDSYGVQSNWSDPLAVRIAKPEVSIGKISGGFASVILEIKNIGDANATQIPWSVTLKRWPNDYPAQFNKHFGGNITTILPGATHKVRCLPVFGFGGVKITVKAYDTEIIVKGIILGVFVVITST